MDSNPYGSILLNDLHRHFPDLLYRSERFQSVQDVLQYVISIAQENPFERNRLRFLSSSSQDPPALSSQEQQEYKQERVQEQERIQEESEQKEENESKEPYQFHVSSSAYVVSSPSEPEPVEVPTFVPASQGQGSAEQPSNTQEILRLMMSRRQREDSSDPASVLLRLLNGRPSQPATSRFRISVPLRSNPLLSSQYSSPVPSILQSLSQLQNLQDLLQPVAVRPTEQQLSENTYVYRSEVSLNDNCAICQDPMEAGQETRTILACSHCFHRECVDRWFQEHVRCPTCRRDVREGSE